MPEEFDRTRERVRELLAAAAAEVDQDVTLERLRTLRQAREAIDTFEADALHAARAAEHDWSEIGAALGMSGQAAGKRARQRYQLTDPRTDPDTGRPATRGPYRARHLQAVPPAEPAQPPAVEPVPEPPPMPPAEQAASTEPPPEKPAPRPARGMRASSRRKTAAGGRRRTRYTTAELNDYRLEPIKSETSEILRYRVLIAGDDLGAIQRAPYGHTGWQASTTNGVPVPHTGAGRYAKTRQTAVVDLLAELGITSSD